MALIGYAAAFAFRPGWRMRLIAAPAIAVGTLAIYPLWALLAIRHIMGGSSAAASVPLLLLETGGISVLAARGPRARSTAVAWKPTAYPCPNAGPLGHHSIEPPSVEGSHIMGEIRPIRRIIEVIPEGEPVIALRLATVKELQRGRAEVAVGTANCVGELSFGAAVIAGILASLAGLDMSATPFQEITSRSCSWPSWRYLHGASLFGSVTISRGVARPRAAPSKAVNRSMRTSPPFTASRNPLPISNGRARPLLHRLALG